MPWLRKVNKNEHGSDCDGPFVRDLRHSLKRLIHDQQRLGQTNQEANYVQYWGAVLKCVLQDVSIGYWAEKKNTRCQTQLSGTRTKHNGADLEYGQAGSNSQNGNCPWCGEHDSWGHIRGRCSHLEMKKMHIHKHNEAASTIINAVNKGNHGSFFIIATYISAVTLADLGVHHKRIPTWVLPDSELNSICYDETRYSVRTKMRPDVIVVELTR